MSITYTPATNFGAKDSLPTNDPDKVIKGSEFTTEFVAIQTAFGLAAPAASPTFTGTVTIASVDINGGTIDGVTIGGSSAGAITGTTITGTSFVSSGDMTFGDNDKAIFGAGSDLQIYHDGSHSFISDQGTGNLRLLAENFQVKNAADDEAMIVAVPDAGVTLYYNNNAKLATTSTGIDVTGTVTADGLTSSGLIKTGGTSLGFVLNETDTTDLNSYINLQSGNLRFMTTNDAFNSFDTRLNINNATGDIAFYEDTGTTPKFFWDASAEALGIGTTSPSRALEVSTDGTAQFRLSRVDSTINGNNTIGSIEFMGTDDTAGTIGATIVAAAETTWGGGSYPTDLRFSTMTGSTLSERMRITSAGNVGIGVTAPGLPLEIKKNGAGETTLVRLRSDDGADQGFLDIAVNATNNETIYKSTGSARGQHVFSDGLSERMRIDSSGNLLVGVTSNSSSVAGVTAGNSGLITACRSANYSGIFNRLSTDGDIVQFRKDSTTVGSISTIGSAVYLGTGNTMLLFRDASNDIRPVISGGTNRDDVTDLGASSARFDNIYATNGTIQTSDRNEKQDIEELDDAERRVAIACKGLLRKFRWISIVEEKGDDARIHFGIIAQDLQAAFEAEGLDAGRYAMFIHSTWTDEETGEERSRMGVRYSELLAFIIAAL